MLSSTNFWMGFAGLIYLFAGVLIHRKNTDAARGSDRLIALSCIFIAVSLAMFAPEHFGGPEFVRNMVPSYMPAHSFWPYFVGCALLAAATSLTAMKCVRLSSTLLGLMFFLFVCMLYLPSALKHPQNRMAWTFVLRELSFCAGAWALVGVYSRNSSPQQSKWMILFARIVLAIAAVFYGVQHFLHPKSAPGVPLELMTPSWVPLPSVWVYLAGSILLGAGIALAVNKKARLAAASIGVLMTFLTALLYGLMLLFASGEAETNLAFNYVADTLLYAGSALAVASALPREPDRLQKA
jgi:uncharacterized membrane protein